MPSGIYKHKITQGFQKGYKQTEQQKEKLRLFKFKKGHKLNVGNQNTKDKSWKIKNTSNMKGQNSKGYSRTNEQKQKLREWNINHPNKKFSGTSIELKMREELDKRGFIKDIDYFCNVGLNKIANVDIYLPEYKIVIECDGCRYHYCKQCKTTSEHFRDRPANDKRKTERLQNTGYFVYRFWEHEINKSVTSCLNLIKT